MRNVVEIGNCLPSGLEVEAPKKMIHNSWLLDHGVRAEQELEAEVSIILDGCLSRETYFFNNNSLQVS